MINSILVIRFSALGDVVLLTILLRALRTQFETAHIDVLTKPAFKPLLETHPAVNEILCIRPDQSLKDVAGTIRERSYTIKVDAHRSLRSGIIRRFVPGRWHTIRKQRWDRLANIWTGRNTTLSQVGSRYAATVADLGVQPDGKPPDLHFDDRDRQRAHDIVTGEYVVLAVGAQHHTKRWPQSHWQTLSINLSKRGIQTVGLGLPHEASTLADSVSIDAYNLPIRSAVALVAGAKAVVANDSGMMHVASAVGVPVVAIYGPTDPRLGYAPHTPRATIVSTSIGCSPCSVFGGARCPAGHHRCMLSLLPAEVLKALEGYL